MYTILESTQLVRPLIIKALKAVLFSKKQIN